MRPLAGLDKWQIQVLRVRLRSQFFFLRVHDFTQTQLCKAQGQSRPHSEFRAGNCQMYDPNATESDAGCLSQRNLQAVSMV